MPQDPRRIGEPDEPGAVDFGLIVDGAVIVVENVVRRLAEAQRDRPSPLSADERRDVVAAAATEVRAATVFGEAIIAMVYVPILSLTGIEESCSTRWRPRCCARSWGRCCAR